MPSWLQISNQRQKVAIYTADEHISQNISQLIETITIGQLFSNFYPLSLQEWFCKGSDSHLKRTTSLETFLSPIRNFKENKIIPTDILDEFYQIRIKKPIEKPKYSINLLRYALVLRYTSMQVYNILLEQLSVPYLTLLRKLHRDLLYNI